MTEESIVNDEKKDIEDKKITANKSDDNISEKKLDDQNKKSDNKEEESVASENNLNKEKSESAASEADKTKDETKVFIKGDQGTYGMGISVVSSGEEVLNFNRKSRNKMDIGKNKIKFSSVIVQEGVDTILKYDNMPAEVTIYLVGGKSVGGFMRANTQKQAHENLNSKGMVFKKFCISEIRQDQDHKAKEAVYSIVARLSAIAAAIEIDKLKKD